MKSKCSKTLAFAKGKGYMGISVLFLNCFYDSELFQNLRKKEEKEGKEGGRK